MIHNSPMLSKYLALNLGKIPFLAHNYLVIFSLGREGDKVLKRIIWAEGQVLCTG